MHQLLRYFLASGLALAADFSVAFASLHLGKVHPVLAATAGYGVGCVVAYVISSRWVFIESRYSSDQLGLLVFSLLGTVGMGLTAFIIEISSLMGISFIAAKVLSSATGFFCNYLLRKTFLFSRSRETELTP